MFSHKLQGSHEDLSIKNYLKVISWSLRSLTRIFHWSNNPRSTTSSTTLQVSCFWSMCVPLVSLKLWSDFLPKCGIIFPEFRKSLKRKKKKKIQTCDSKKNKKNRTKKFLVKWQVGLPWLQRDHDGVEDGGRGRTFGEWKLIREYAFWGLLTQMASALKIKCPTP